MTALQAEGCGIALTGDEHKVSVTGLAFCVIGAAVSGQPIKRRPSTFLIFPCGGRGGCGFPFLPHKKGCDEMIFISSQPFYLFFFQPAMKFHLPGAAGRTFPVPTAAAAAAAQGDPVNMTAGQNEADGNDSQYCVSANTHEYPSFLREYRFPLIFKRSHALAPAPSTPSSLTFGAGRRMK